MKYRLEAEHCFSIAYISHDQAFENIAERRYRAAPTSDEPVAIRLAPIDIWRGFERAACFGGRETNSQRLGKAEYNLNDLESTSLRPRCWSLLLSRPLLPALTALATAVE